MVDRKSVGLVLCKILTILWLDDLEYVATYEYQPVACNYFKDGRSSVNKLFYDQQNYQITMEVIDHVLTVKKIDAFEQYPFRMNIWDAELLTKSSPSIYHDQWMPILPKYNEPDFSVSKETIWREIPDFKWNDHNVWIVMFPSKKSKTLKINLVPRSSWENETYWLCQIDEIYFKLTLTNCCCPYQIPSDWKWFIIEHGAFLYFFFPNSVLIISTSLLDVPYNPTSPRSFLRFTNLSYEKFIVCQKKTVWYQILKFHRSNPFIYGVHLFNLIVVGVSLYYLHSFCFEPKKGNEYELDEWMDEFDEDNDPDNPNQDLIAFFTRFFRKAPPNIDDRIGRTIPMLTEKPKFKLIMSTPHRRAFCHRQHQNLKMHSIGRWTNSIYGSNFIDGSSVLDDDSREASEIIESSGYYTDGDDDCVNELNYRNDHSKFKAIQKLFRFSFNGTYRTKIRSKETVAAPSSDESLTFDSHHKYSSKVNKKLGAWSFSKSKWKRFFQFGRKEPDLFGPIDSSGSSSYDHDSTNCSDVPDLSQVFPNSLYPMTCLSTFQS